jgi:hypothetical protein
MIYTNNESSGHWPVGIAAIVIADTPEEAADILNLELKRLGLPGDGEAKDMIPFPQVVGEDCRILRDGNY